MLGQLIGVVYKFGGGYCNIVLIMVIFRCFCLDDVNCFFKCNLDFLIEIYEFFFYFQYYVKWFLLFQVCEDKDGNIIGYSEYNYSMLYMNSLLSVFIVIVMGKVEFLFDVYKFLEYYFFWYVYIIVLMVVLEV